MQTLFQLHLSHTLENLEKWSFLKNLRETLIIIIINLFGKEGQLKNLQYNTDVNLQKCVIKKIKIKEFVRDVCII